MKLSSIEIITDIQPHPNADKLELAKVLGYTCIVGKDTFKVGDHAVLIQPDTVLPDAEWAAVFKKKSNRVRACKIRGQWSFGIVMPIAAVTNIEVYNVGMEISPYIGVIKYEAPVPQQLDAKGSLPFNLNKTDEERYQNLVLPFGDLVDVTLKVDGQSATYYCKKVGNDWETGICSRTLELKPEMHNNYTWCNKLYSILANLHAYCIKHDVSLALRGEIFGKGIQAHSINPHAKLLLDFNAYSVFNMDKLEYENKYSEHYYTRVCEAIEVPTVLMVESDVKLTPELIKHYAEDCNEINGRPFEGVVIKHANGSFKVINLAYDEGK